ncbi:MAG: hypothetical protein A3E07_02850 [Candidatus Wildermuthbacteria bacterium RIFCSPHIGHO2_12_FULL_45_9]|nr:MAG: hypothetical protein A3E07_02850 [Candidatus Wildermuthbacteria bacterium RIFCSPHIGHO2_12_FULL_45_9]
MTTREVRTEGVAIRSPQTAQELSLEVVVIPSPAYENFGATFFVLKSFMFVKTYFSTPPLTLRLNKAILKNTSNNFSYERHKRAYI